MRKHTYYLILACLILSLISCTDKRTGYRNDIQSDCVMEITPSDDALRLSEIIDDYQLILPEGILLASIDKVLIWDSTLIVKGLSPDNGYVHLFDRNGKFIKTILKGGQGPKEAGMNLSAMKLNGDNLYFLINGGMEMMCYSLKEGQITDRFRLPEEIFAACDFEVLDTDLYIFYKDMTRIGGKEYKLYVYDKTKEQIEKRWIALNKESTSYLSFGQSDCLYKHGGKCYFHEVFQKGIYEVGTDSLQGHVTFKANKYTMPDNVLYDSYPSLVDFVIFCQGASYVWAYRSLREGSRFITATYQVGKDYYWHVMDKKEQLSHSYARIEDDVLLEAEISLKDYMFQTNIQEDMRIFSLPYDLLDGVMQKKDSGQLVAFAHKNPKLMNIYQHMNEDSNEIIVMFHEKK